MSDPAGVPQNVVLRLRVEWRTEPLLLHIPEQTAPSEDPRYQEAVWEHRRPPTTQHPLQCRSTGGGGDAGEWSRGSGNRGRQRGQISHFTLVPQHVKPQLLFCSQHCNVLLLSLFHQVCTCKQHFGMLDQIPSYSFCHMSLISIVYSTVVEILYLNTSFRYLYFIWVLLFLPHSTSTPPHLRGKIVLFTPLHLSDSISYFTD